MGVDITNRWDYTGDAVIGTGTKDSVTNVDFKVTDAEIYVTGGEILFKDAAWGDYIEVKIVESTQTTEVKTYIKKQYLHPDLKKEALKVPYAGAIPQNYYIRVKYHSTSTTTDVPFAVNYHLHKKVR